jgi:hypothetical protein
METRQSVRWVHESGPIGRLSWGAFIVGIVAIAALGWTHAFIGRYVGWPDQVRRMAMLALVGLIMAFLCAWRLRRPHYVRTEVNIGPEGIHAESTRHAKLASDADRGGGWSIRRGLVPWERVRSIVVQSHLSGTKARHVMQVQYRLRLGGGGTWVHIPDAEMAGQAVEVAREYLPAKAVRTHRTVLPTERQSWWLAGLSLVWAAIVLWIMARWGYRPNFESLWILAVVFGYGPGIPWALAITKGRFWRSPMPLLIATQANVAANFAAAMVLMTVRIVMQAR